MATQEVYISIAKHIENCQQQVPSIGRSGAIAAVIVDVIINAISASIKAIGVINKQTAR